MTRYVEIRNQTVPCRKMVSLKLHGFMTLHMAQLQLCQIWNLNLGSEYMFLVCQISYMFYLNQYLFSLKMARTSRDSPLSVDCRYMTILKPFNQRQGTNITPSLWSASCQVNSIWLNTILQHYNCITGENVTETDKPNMLLYHSNKDAVA